jgi:hypothetical protein
LLTAADPVGAPVVATRAVTDRAGAAMSTLATLAVANPMAPDVFALAALAVADTATTAVTTAVARTARPTLRVSLRRATIFILLTMILLIDARCALRSLRMDGEVTPMGVCWLTGRHVSCVTNRASQSRR